MKIIIHISIFLLLISCNPKQDKVNPLVKIKQEAEALSKKVDEQIKNNKGVYKSTKEDKPKFIITDYKGHIMNKDKTFGGVIYQAHLEGNTEINAMIEYKMVNGKIESTLIMKKVDSDKYDKELKQ